MKKFFAQRKWSLLCSVAAIALIFVAWTVAYYAEGRNDLLVPSLPQSLEQIGVCFASEVFWRSFGGTLLRTLYAFAVSFALAAVFAAVSAICKPLGRMASTVIAVLRTVPTLAIALVVWRWAGSSGAPVVVTSLVLFPMIYAQFLAAFGGIDAGLKEMAKIYRLGNRDKIFKIYLPQVAPNLLSQVGADLSMGLKITVSAEVLSYTLYSVGYLMQNASVRNTALLAALTIICIAAGLLIEAVCYNLRFLTRKWTQKENGDDH